MEAGQPALQIVVAITGDGFAGFDELQIPGVEFTARGMCLQQRVALLERSRIAAPQRQERGFHVEQPPIQQATPGFAASGDQHMAARFESHHGEGSTQLAKMTDGVAIQSAFPRLSAMAQASAMEPSGSV